MTQNTLTTHEPLIELREVNKTFGAVAALTKVTMEIRPHEVVGLIGENGAGKSTLLKIMSGVYQPDTGAVFRDSKEAKLGSPRIAAQHGIGIVHQEQSLVPTLTVAENILLGNEKSSVKMGLMRWSSMRSKAKKFLERVGLDVDPMALTESLSFAQRQMVEIAKALAVIEDSGVAPVIILDEPTSVLEAKDIAVLEAEVSNLKKLGSVIFISHRLDEVLRMSDRVYVMRGGQIVAERKADEADEEELYRLMIGRETSSTYYQEDRRVPYQSTRPMIEVKNLSVRRQFSDVSFEAHAGEALSIVGVTGSGREELVRALFGSEPCHGGNDHIARETDDIPVTEARCCAGNRLYTGGTQSRRNGCRSVGREELGPGYTKGCHQIRSDRSAGTNQIGGTVDQRSERATARSQG